MQMKEERENDKVVWKKHKESCYYLSKNYIKYM